MQTNKTPKPTKIVKQQLMEIVSNIMSKQAAFLAACLELSLLSNKALAEQNRTKIVVARFQAAVASNEIELSPPVKLLMEFLARDFSTIDPDIGVPEQYMFKAFMKECENIQSEVA